LVSVRRRQGFVHGRHDRVNDGRGSFAGRCWTRDSSAQDAARGNRRPNLSPTKINGQGRIKHDKLSTFTYFRFWNVCYDGDGQVQRVRG
jgi:hypothetical protein